MIRKRYQTPPSGGVFCFEPMRLRLKSVSSDILHHIMKKLLTILIPALALTLLHTSCSKDDDGGGSGSNRDSLTVVLSKDTVVANQFDFAQVTIKDTLGNDITSACSIWVNGVARISSTYYPSGPGTYVITATLNNRPCKPARLIAIPPPASPYTQKALVEDCTGTWCGYCTRIANALDQIKTANPDVICVTVHGGGTDPFKFKYYTTYNNSFGVTGFPTVILNRKGEWDEYPSSINNAMQRWSPLGLSIASSIGNGEISGTVKVKFSATSTTPMKLVIALVENNLVYPQTNYYSSLYGGANPISNFVHNGVLRRTATELFGDPIPVSEQVEGHEYSVPFTLPLTGQTYDGTTFNAVAANCGVVAFAVDASPAQSGTLNAQYAAAGTVQDYD